jgi:hypothetical protein
MPLNFFDLTAETLLDYGEFIRKDKGSFWFFHHIPKTAGSSIRRELQANVGGYHNVLPDYNDDARPFFERLDEAFAIMMTDLLAGKLQCASGHVFGRHAAALFATDPHVKLFTFLRHPLKRAISEYNYNSSAAHPPHATFKARYPTFDAFALDATIRNKMSLYLFERQDIELDEAIELLKKRYVMVGIQERYPASFLLLSALAWRPTLPRFRERVAAAGAADSVTVDLRRQFMALNKLDFELYQAVEDIYVRLTPAIWSILSPQGANA